MVIDSSFLSLRRPIMAAWAVLSLCVAASTAAQAQGDDMATLKQEISTMAGVLEDALDLSGATGLFGLSTGGVEGSYLQGQGVVFEIRSPLSGQRNRLGMASLGNSVRSLIPARNPFTLLNSSGSARADLASAESANSSASEAVGSLANIDYSLVVSNALQQSANAARALKELSQVDAQEYAALQQQVETLQSSLQANVDRLRGLAEQQGSESAASWDEKLDQLMLEIEPLKQRSLEFAEDLKQRARAAEQAAAESWTARLEAFEAELLQTLCTEGGIMASLPSGERVTTVLVGLGGSVEDETISDKIHVLQGSDLASCRSGAIDLAELRGRMVSYSY